MLCVLKHSIVQGICGGGGVGNGEQNVDEVPIAKVQVTEHFIHEALEGLGSPNVIRRNSNIPSGVVTDVCWVDRYLVVCSDEVDF